MTNYHALVAKGWSPFFQQQLTLEEWNDAIPARVAEQHKSILCLLTESDEIKMPITPAMPTMVVGDWVLLDSQQQFIRLLDRKSCFKRKAAGTQVGWQLISSNVDAAFVVCSLNEDFNLSRIERYQALAFAADVEPVVVLTKADLVDESESWVEQVSKLNPQVAVVAINARDPACAQALSPWLGNGKTAVLLGSSGVGKSTLSNTLLGSQVQATQGIRADDDKGRHTTTTRALLTVPCGGLLLDTPGMRELQLADCHDGIESAFADIELLAEGCRFSNCSHQNEPGCAVKKALALEQLDPRRYNNYLKLVREEAHNSASLSERRAIDKSFGKLIKQTLKDKHKFKGSH